MGNPRILGSDWRVALLGRLSLSLSRVVCAKKKALRWWLRDTGVTWKLAGQAAGRGKTSNRGSLVQWQCWAECLDSNWTQLSAERCWAMRQSHQATVGESEHHRMGETARGNGSNRSGGRENLLQGGRPEWLWPSCREGAQSIRVYGLATNLKAQDHCRRLLGASVSRYVH